MGFSSPPFLAQMQNIAKRYWSNFLMLQLLLYWNHFIIIRIVFSSKLVGRPLRLALSYRYPSHALPFFQVYHPYKACSNIPRIFQNLWLWIFLYHLSYTY